MLVSVLIGLAICGGIVLGRKKKMQWLERVSWGMAAIYFALTAYGAYVFIELGATHQMIGKSLIGPAIVAVMLIKLFFSKPGEGDAKA